MNIHKYIREGDLTPTIVWLKDENDQYWMVQLQRPAKLSDILPHKCYQQPGTPSPSALASCGFET